MNLILFKPKLLGIKNSVARRGIYSSQNLRDLIILALAAVIMILIYKGTLWAIVHINANPNLLFLPPRYPLGMILALLFFMLCISGMAIAIGSLFHSQDLDLILATPLKQITFFKNKLLYIVVNSSWMPLIFIVPLFLAFGQAYDAPPSYYFLSTLILIPYFFIAASLACIVSLLAGRYIPASRSREVLILVVIACLIIVYMLVDLVSLGFAGAQDNTTITRLVSFLSLADISWMPSHWVAVCMQDFIFRRDANWPAYLPLLFCSAVGLVSLAHIIFAIIHFNAYTNSRNTRRALSYARSYFKSVLRMLFMDSKRTERALVEKEALNFTRDVTHTIQLLMLLGLCAIYIFNLRVFLDIESFPADSREWWQKFFFVSNSSIAAFVTTGFCTRFVFISLSLEGKSLWILQTSPLSLKEILEAKFRSWYLPVAVLGSLVFCAAGLSLGVDRERLLVSLVVSWIICYGIVGIAIGMGARFANFSWEHSSQLAAGFGNMVFMISSIGLIALNLVPACIMLFYNPERLNLSLSPGILQALLIASMLLSMLVLNLLAKRVAIKSGLNSLSRHLDSQV